MHTTRAAILAKAAPLFNQRGFAGVSLSDIMTATGLKKGGIYNHFDSKEHLALAAFDYALRQVRRRFIEALQGAQTPTESLRAILGVMQRSVTDPPVEGGCPILNTAIESDDAHPALRARARQAMDELQDYIRVTVQRGIATGDFRASADPEDVATLFIAMLDGALMLSKLYGDDVHMTRAVAHLNGYINDYLLIP